jgi:hypothetical protein
MVKPARSAVDGQTCLRAEVDPRKLGSRNHGLINIRC